MRESIKRITNWAAKYITHQRSYYPVPEVAMDLGDVPKLNPIPVVSMDRDNIVKMREWARERGQCVRQLTVRQQTTKFSAGTLILTAYSVKPRQDPLDMNVEDPSGRPFWKTKKIFIPIPICHYLLTSLKTKRMLGTLCPVP